MIAPYAGHHIQNFSMEEYSAYAERLMELGFTVLTNSNDIAKEPPVPGTIPICLPFHLVAPLISEGGIFIGQRSGLCDIVASAKDCKRIILYPKQKIGEGVVSLMAFFSLKKMDLCEDVIEIEMNTNNFRETLIQIIDIIDGWDIL